MVTIQIWEFAIQYLLSKVAELLKIVIWIFYQFTSKMQAGQSFLVFLIFAFHAKSFDIQIIGGEDVELGERPWQVL